MPNVSGASWVKSTLSLINSTIPEDPSGADAASVHEEILESAIVISVLPPTQSVLIKLPNCPSV
jgi:hypothetical protein